jgi:hypothetical protein
LVSLFGTDYAADTDVFAFFAVKIWAPKFLLHTILRRGIDLTFYFNVMGSDLSNLSNCIDNSPKKASFLALNPTF